MKNFGVNASRIDRWAALSMADSPRIAGRLRAILSGPPTARQAASGRRMASGGAVLGAGALAGLTLFRPALLAPLHAEPATPSRVTQLVLPPPDPRYVKHLIPHYAEAVTVELMSVSSKRFGNGDSPAVPSGQDAGAIKASWTPSGRLLPYPMVPNGMSYSDDANIAKKRVIELAFRIRGPIDDRVDMTADADNPPYYQEDDNKAERVSDFTIRRQPGSLDLYVVDGSVGGSVRKADFNILIAQGPWGEFADERATFATGFQASSSEFDGLNPSYKIDCQGKEATFSRPFLEGKGRYGFVVTDNNSIRESQARVVGITRSGKIVEADQSSQLKTNNYRQTTVTFDATKIPLADLKTVRIESRPYLFAGFEGVALYPKTGGK